MEKKDLFSVPDDFEEYLDELTKKQKELKKKIDAENRKTKQNELNRERRLKLKTKKNLKDAKTIFKWVEKFWSSTTGERVFELTRTTARQGPMIEIFKWRNQAHSLYITKNSIRWYAYGPGSEEDYCKTPEELARCSQTAMLNACCKAITNGEVWQCIKADLDFSVDRELRIDELGLNEN